MFRAFANTVSLTYLQTMHAKPTLLFLLLLVFGLTPAQEYNPVADTGAVVLQGNARFTVLSDKLIRLEYAPDGHFNDNATLTFVNRLTDVPEFTVEHQGGYLLINTSFLHLKYKENSGAFNARNLSINYTYKAFEHTEKGGCGDIGPDWLNARTVPEMTYTWHPGMKDHRNLKGTTRTLDGALGKFTFNGMKKLPIEDGIISRSGWAFVDDTHKPLFDNSDWAWVQERKNSGAQDWYFFGYGYHYKDALRDFTNTSGKISLPPRYAFGVWYSRFWKYSEQDMKDIVNDYAKRDIPLDVLVVDMDWHQTESSNPALFKNSSPKLNGWTGFTWEKKYFPDYKEFLSWTDKQNLQTCLNIHPAAGVQWHEQAYPAFAKAMHFDTLGHKAIPFDITNKNFAKAYFDVLLHPYEKDGIDFWWLDWQQWGGTNIKGVNPTFYLNYVHYSDMQRQGKRPLIFHRYGGLGNQRYQIGFSGDYMIDWKGLSYQPEFTSTAANVGYGYWSHDIGGHMNPVNKANKHNPELFTRWVEWGAFSPIFRTHATADPEIERRIWLYPDENFKAMRKALQMRYALLPYIYTYARASYDYGISLVHPMYYEFPDLDEAYKHPHQYYFGDDMIVAPVHESMNGEKAITQSVWLPEGTWFDYRNNKAMEGGRNITATYALDEVPVFVRAGAIVPTQTAKTRITGSVMDTLILTIYPDLHNTGVRDSANHEETEATATFALYEDDGTTEAYKNSSSNYTYFNYSDISDEKTFTIEPGSGKFDGILNERAYEVRIVNAAKPSRITLNDKPVTNWRFDDGSKLLTVFVPRMQVEDLKLRFY